jgi:hypothetical protein
MPRTVRRFREDWSQESAPLIEEPADVVLTEYSYAVDSEAFRKVQQFFRSREAKLHPS